jgi:hypothetical protein
MGDTEEVPPVFDAVMYPLGINADFTNVSELQPVEVLTTFINRFENSELRDIAKCHDQLVELFKSYGLSLGSVVADIVCTVL